MTGRSMTETSSLLLLLLLAVPSESAEELWVPVERRAAERWANAACREYTIEMVTVYNEGVLSEAGEGVVSEGATNDSGSRNGHPETVEARIEYKLDFPNGRVRIDDFSPLWSHGSFQQGHTQVLFDGSTGVLLNPLAHSGSRNSAVKADLKPVSFSTRLALILPLLWYSGIYDPPDITAKTRTPVPELGGDWKKEGALLAWSRIRKPFPMNIKLYIDPALDYHVVRMQTIPRNGPNDIPGEVTNYQISYSENSAHPEVTGWTVSSPGTFDRSIHVTVARKLDALPIEEFQEPSDYLKAGMRVAKDGQSHVVSGSGSLVPWVPGQPLQTRSRSWLIWTCIVAAISAAVWGAQRFLRT